MADVFSKAKRFEVMSRIRSRGNKDTELALARLLRANGISGWRRQIQIRTSPRPSPQKSDNSSQPSPGLATLFHSRGRGKRGEGEPRRNSQRSMFDSQLTVRPDFVFLKLKLALFVDGCFWHGCPRHCNPMKWLKKSSMPQNNSASLKGGPGRTSRAF